MNSAIRVHLAQDVVERALRLMDPLETDKPLDLHGAASRLGVLPRDLDVALWNTLGERQ